MTYLNDKILKVKSFFFYLTTPDEIIKIIKSFSNNKSAGPNSLPTSILKNCAHVLSFPISYLVNLSFTIGEFPNLCKIAKFFEKVISLIVVIMDLYPYSPHLVQYLKFIYKGVYYFLAKNNLIFKRKSGLCQVIPLIIQK